MRSSRLASHSRPYSIRGATSASVGLMMALSAAANGAAYRVEVMTIPNGGVQTAEAINSSGIAAVSLFGPAQAGTWDGGLKRALFAAGSDPWVVALGINDQNTVVGYTGNASQDLAPVKWPAGATAAIELPTFGIRFGRALDINDAGDIVGSLDLTLQFGDNDNQAVLWPASGGVVALIINQPGEFSDARAINNRGDIVGENQRQAYFRPAGANSAAQNIGTLGASFSYAVDVNDFGEVVGNSREQFGAVDLPFRWRDTTGVMVSLGTLRGVGAFAQAINNRGQIVGHDAISSSSASTDRAFIINPGGTMTDLNTLIPATSGWTLTRATAINNAGVIVGVGRFQNQEQAFILTPDSPAAFVPCLADLNRDLSINTADLVRLLGDFGQSGAPGFASDVNGDGSVNTSDLVFFLGAFGASCT
ncbi:MAG: dockerin type I domain-containing protein [Phycisphaerales bacterium]